MADPMEKCLLNEVTFRTSRASGPGGQHVNKTETRVELVWDVKGTSCLDESQKSRVLRGLSSRLTREGLLVLSSQRYRSQIRNREEVKERFLLLVRSTLVVPGRRYRTRPSAASREKRIRSKKIRGEVKRLRKGLSYE